MVVQVTDNGTVSEAFAVSNKAKQGSTFAPLLFIFMFSAILMGAYHDESPRIRILYKTDCDLFYSWRIQDQARLSTTSVRDLLFAGDCEPGTMTNPDTQRSMDLFASGYVNLGLTINMD
ncbi:hypothetical protein SprV_0301244800 [Sparganum proliferum]